MNEVYLKQLRTIAKAMDDVSDPDLGDDALIYAGSATWEQWQNHVPGILRSMWPLLDEPARLAVYITAKQFTTYDTTTTPRGQA